MQGSTLGKVLGSIGLMMTSVAAEQRRKREQEQEKEERDLRMLTLKNQMARMKEEQARQDREESRRNFEMQYKMREGTPGPSVPGTSGTPGGMENLADAQPGTPQVFRSPLPGLPEQNFPHLPIADPWGGTMTPQTRQELQGQAMRDLELRRRIEQQTQPPPASSVPLDPRRQTQEIEQIQAAQRPVQPPQPRGYGSSSLGIYNQDTGDIAHAAPPQTDRSITPFEAWQQQNPGKSVEEFLKMQGSARAASRPAYQPKDVATAKQKLTMISVARNQLENIKKKWEKAKGISAGPGAGMLPTPSGQAFDVAVNAIRNSVVGLTRIPGVGQMSDYETRLMQAPMPDRNKYEAVTEQQIEQLDSLFNLLEKGYLDIAGSGVAPSVEPQPQGGEGPTATNPQTGEKLILRNGQWVPAQ